MLLYHYTSVTLLRKILASGKLLPSGTLGWRLLWATSSSTIDPTATCVREPIVARFTLRSCDFKPWSIVRSRFRQEKLELAEEMEQRVAHFVDPDRWYVRYTALPADRWLRIDTRDQRWQPYVSGSWRRQRPLWLDDDFLADSLAEARQARQIEEEEEEVEFE
jgi:hypothetical protein